MEFSRKSYLQKMISADGNGMIKKEGNRRKHRRLTVGLAFCL